MPIPEELARKIVNALQDATNEARQICAALVSDAKKWVQQAKDFYTKRPSADTLKGYNDARFRESEVAALLPFVDAYALVLEGLVWLAAGKTNRGFGTFREGLRGVWNPAPYALDAVAYSHPRQEGQRLFQLIQEGAMRHATTCKQAEDLVTAEGCKNANEVLSLVRKIEGWSTFTQKACTPLRRVFARVEYDVIEALESIPA